MPKESYKEKAPPTPISTPAFRTIQRFGRLAPEIRAVRGRPAHFNFVEDISTNVMFRTVRG